MDILFAWIEAAAAWAWASYLTFPVWAQVALGILVLLWLVRVVRRVVR